MIPHQKTLAKLEQRLEKLSYKPGWILELRYSQETGWGLYGDAVLYISAFVENTYAKGVGDDPLWMGFPGDLHRSWPRIKIESRCPFRLEAFMDGGRLDEDRFQDWVFYQIMKIEKHEAQEWFKRDGIIVDDPHRPHGWTPGKDPMQPW